METVDLVSDGKANANTAMSRVYVKTLLGCHNGAKLG